MTQIHSYTQYVLLSPSMDQVLIQIHAASSSTASHYDSILKSPLSGRGESWLCSVMAHIVIAQCRACTESKSQ